MDEKMYCLIIVNLNLLGFKVSFINDEMTEIKKGRKVIIVSKEKLYDLFFKELHYIEYTIEDLMN